MKAASCQEVPQKGRAAATVELLPLATKRVQKVGNIDETCHVRVCVCVCVHVRLAAHYFRLIAPPGILALTHTR